MQLTVTRVPPKNKKFQTPLKPVISPTSEESPPLPPRCSNPISPRSNPTSPRLQTLPHSPQHKAVTFPSTNASPDECRSYLRSFSVTDTLKLLEEMNLGQFRTIFQGNNIDGKVLLSYTKYELEEIGIIDSVVQKRLLDVISGQTTYKIK